MKLIYEKMTDVLYIRAKKGKVGKTVELNKHTLVDLDKAGNLIGIEVLFASKHVSKKLIKSGAILQNCLTAVSA